MEQQEEEVQVEEVAAVGGCCWRVSQSPGPHYCEEIE